MPRRIGAWPLEAIKLPNALSALESFCKNNSPVLCISERDSFMASTYGVCKRKP